MRYVFCIAPILFFHLGCATPDRQPFIGSHNIPGKIKAQIQHAEANADTPSWRGNFEEITSSEDCSWYYLAGEGFFFRPESRYENSWVLTTIIEDIPPPIRIRAKRGFNFLTLNEVKDSHYSLYVLEDYCRTSGLIYEDIKLGIYYFRRYFIPWKSQEEKSFNMLIVYLVSRGPIKTHEYVLFQDEIFNVVEAQRSPTDRLFAYFNR